MKRLSIKTIKEGTKPEWDLLLMISLLEGIEHPISAERATNKCCFLKNLIWYIFRFPQFSIPNISNKFSLFPNASDSFKKLMSCKTIKVGSAISAILHRWLIEKWRSILLIKFWYFALKGLTKIEKLIQGLSTR